MQDDSQRIDGEPLRVHIRLDIGDLSDETAPEGSPGRIVPTDEVS
jgi:hypothetical protein